MNFKSTLFLAPPLIALSVVLVLIRNQRHETRLAESSNAATEEPAKHRRSRPESVTEPSVIDPGKSGWKSFAMRMWSLTENGDPASMHALNAYQERIGGMSADELDAAMDAVEGISFPDPEAGKRLMAMFCRQMCGKAPARLLERARNRMENGRFTMTWNLREALTKVAATSPRDAVVWMDEVIAKGAFDHSGANRYSPMWLDFEKALVCGLIPGDSALAEQRLAALPEEVRPSLLRDELTGPSGDPATQPAYLSICRKFLDADEMCERISSLASTAAGTGGLTAVSNLLARIETTPDERSEMLDNVVSAHMRFAQRNGKLDLREVENVRSWITKLGVGDLGKATGDALGFLASTQGFEPQSAYDAVRRYHDESGSDTLLAEFLGWPAVWREPETCVELAGRIRNEKLRKKSMTKP